ncbi:protein preli-like [Lutzomyia longipalpis]|uniref:PRELI/MSF1 domain-containing protein n=1 Tax=Lutzomyia longipalpis TaxID=7200 RepID=A0A1B0C9D2_LUTLO|nr:protein preli-like [Lutzomyia longipalpis]
MVRYYEEKTTFNFAWEQVALAFWQKYPNPHSNHVLTEDTVQREVRDGKLYSKRLLSKTNRVPKWGERFYNAKSVKIVEESVCDPREQMLVTYTRNIAFTKIMSVTEKVVYCSSKDTPGSTVAHRSAWIDSQVFGFSRAISAFGLERFKKNCSKMSTGFNWVLHTLFPNPAHQDLHLLHPATKAQKIKEAARTASDHMKAQAEHIYQVYSVKN